MIGTMPDVFTELRPLLFSIAYRMLGSVSDAEDVVQDAYLRYHRALDGRHRDRVAEGLPLRRHDPAGHRPAALGPGAPRDLRRAVAARAAC